MERLEVEDIHGLARHRGASIGPSPWLLVTQHQIDSFAELTQDRHWVHIDQRRAREELRFGATIAHGLLTLSLMPRLFDSLLSIRSFAHGLNYGADYIRFTAPVRAGASIRLRTTLSAVEPIEGGVRLTARNVLEVEDSDKPAMVADMITLYFA